MSKLEDIRQGARIKGILPGAEVTVIGIKWYGSDAVEVTFKNAAGQLGNEILTGLNTAERFYLAVVQVDGETVNDPAYIPCPFQKEPDFAVTSVNYNLKELLSKGVTP